MRIGCRASVRLKGERRAKIANTPGYVSLYCLRRYCIRERLTFTRCRPYHKDDQAHVEQKNWNIVRQLIGYDRFEGDVICAQLNQIYAVLHVYVNGYLPVMKLVSRERQGAKVTKRYDQAQTPYRRALGSGVIPPAQQTAFEAALTEQGPLALRRRIERDLDRLWRPVGTPGQASAPA